MRVAVKKKDDTQFKMFIKPHREKMGMIDKKGPNIS
jgi:hypothetical protein